MLNIIRVAFAIAFLSGSCLSQNHQTLAAIQQKYLNKKVVIDGKIQNAGEGPQLLSWKIVKSNKKSKYGTTWLDASYKGKTATVISVTANGGSGKVNALGEVLSPDQIIDPYCDILIAFDDGTEALLSAFPSSISFDIKLADERNALLKELEENLPSVVGKTVYATGFCSLYDPTSSLEELLSDMALLKKLHRVPLLTPLQIAAAKYVPNENAVILKLKMPDESFAFSITTSGFLSTTDKKNFLERVAGQLLISIPPGLSEKELSAIQKGTIFRGMSHLAVEFSLGFPDHENDWGKGGRQMVYPWGLMIYLDDDRNVVDWQSRGN
jgi:hypothetical protein